MDVRPNVINSTIGQKTARWSIATLRQWCQEWEKANVGHTTIELSERPITRFMRYKWQEGRLTPSSLNWDRDILTLGEFLCIAVKLLYSSEEENKDGGLMLWILDGIIEASKKWHIASGSNGLSEAISTANWLEQFFEKESENLRHKVQEIKKGIVLSFSLCEPDLTDAPTFHAYKRCLEIMNEWVFDIRSMEAKEPIVRQLKEVIEVLHKARTRIGKSLQKEEEHLDILCNDWLSVLNRPTSLPGTFRIHNARDKMQINLLNIQKNASNELQTTLLAAASDPRAAMLNIVLQKGHS
ncbi:MAG: hypothetical protein H7832_00940 [Magnetococcus sp. DMHC-6]